MKNKTNKIEFLNGLLTGKRSIKEVLPPHSLYLIQIDATGNLFECAITGKKYSRLELEKTFFPLHSQLVISSEGLKNPLPEFVFTHTPEPLIISVDSSETLHALKDLK